VPSPTPHIPHTPQPLAPVAHRHARARPDTHDGRASRITIAIIAIIAVIAIIAIIVTIVTIVVIVVIAHAHDGRAPPDSVCLLRSRPPRSSRALERRDPTAPHRARTDLGRRLVALVRLDERRARLESRRQHTHV